MQQADGYLSNGLFWQSWMPGNAPRAVILIAHGLAEHSARYQHVAERLVEHGYAVFAVDHIGHGRSPGDRVALGRFEDLLSGMDALHALAMQTFAGKPVFILGHSMGGLIAARSVIANPARYAGAVLSGPAVIAPDPPPALQLIIVRLLSKLFPKLGVIALDSSAISTDPEVVENYLNDPLVYTGKITARMAAELFDAMALLREQASAITIPLLVMHGGDDRLTAPEGSRLLVEKAESTDKALYEFPGLFHEIFNEPQRAEVISIMLDWLEARG